MFFKSKKQFVTLTSLKAGLLHAFPLTSLLLRSGPLEDGAESDGGRNTENGPSRRKQRFACLSFYRKTDFHQAKLVYE